MGTRGMRAVPAPRKDRDLKLNNKDMTIGELREKEPRPIPEGGLVIDVSVVKANKLVGDIMKGTLVLRLSKARRETHFRDFR